MSFEDHLGKFHFKTSNKIQKHILDLHFASKARRLKVAQRKAFFEILSVLVSWWQEKLGGDSGFKTNKLSGSAW